MDPKYINQLLNAHKVSSIVVPLIEAVDINKRTQAIKNLKLDDLLKTVITTGGEIYQEILDGDEKLLETGLVPDKLFLMLSKTLRNNVVLFNSTSLSVIKDEILNTFEAHSSFIQKYQNETEKTIAGDKPKSTLEALRETQYAFSYVTSAIAELLMPITIFHSNLYTSGFVDEKRMTELNMQVMDYLITIMDAMVDRMSAAQGHYDEMFKINSISLCAGIMSNILNDFSGKMSKNKKTLELYIVKPEQILSKLTPVFYSSFSTMMRSAEKTISNIM
jgi:hypothetical protein